MNIQRLRYLREIVRRDLNLTAAALALHTSQPGVSRQIQELESELGLQIFLRKGRRLVGITPAGEAVVQIAQRIVGELDNLKRVAQEHESETRGTLSIATTHTQARYALPELLVKFREAFPQVDITLKQGTPDQIAHWLREGDADIGTASEVLQHAPGIVSAAWYQWGHVLAVPRAHPLSEQEHQGPITLQTIAREALLTYDTAFAGRTAINQAFLDHGLEPRVVISALDSDVIKTYVRLGLGLGLIAQMALDPQHDADLVGIDCSHLFGKRTTYVALAAGRLQRAFTHALVRLAVGQTASQTLYEATLPKD